MTEIDKTIENISENESGSAIAREPVVTALGWMSIVEGALFVILSLSSAFFLGIVLFKVGKILNGLIFVGISFLFLLLGTVGVMGGIQVVRNRSRGVFYIKIFSIIVLSLAVINIIVTIALTGLTSYIIIFNKGISVILINLVKLMIFLIMPSVMIYLIFADDRVKEYEKNIDSMEQAV